MRKEKNPSSTTSAGTIKTGSKPGRLKNRQNQKKPDSRMKRRRRTGRRLTPGRVTGADRKKKYTKSGQVIRIVNSCPEFRLEWLVPWDCREKKFPKYFIRIINKKNFQVKKFTGIPEAAPVWEDHL